MQPNDIWGLYSSTVRYTCTDFQQNRSDSLPRPPLSVAIRKKGRSSHLCVTRGTKDLVITLRISLTVFDVDGGKPSFLFSFINNLLASKIVQTTEKVRKSDSISKVPENPPWSHALVPASQFRVRYRGVAQRQISARKVDKSRPLAAHNSGTAATSATATYASTNKKPIIKSYTYVYKNKESDDLSIDCISIYKYSRAVIVHHPSRLKLF